MGRAIRSCFQSILKLVNSIIWMVGIALIVYGAWMIWVWQRKTGRYPFDESDYPVPWFIYVILGMGAIISVISCSGHISAETLNGCCLYLYMFFVLLLLILEGVITADVFLNRNWEQDIPKDATGNLYELVEFVRKNFDFCKWLGLSILVVQGLSFLLALVLKALGPHREVHYDSDEEYSSSSRRPLLWDSHSIDPHPYVVVDNSYGPKKPTYGA